LVQRKKKTLLPKPAKTAIPGFLSFKIRAGIKNPVQVKRKILVFPRIRSVEIMTAKTRSRLYFLPKKNEVKIIAPVTNSRLGPKCIRRPKKASKKRARKRIFFMFLIIMKFGSKTLILPFYPIIGV
jgi:hypothetical protein